MKRALSTSFIASFAVFSADAKPLEVVGTGDGMELVRAVGAAFTAENPDQVIVVPPSIGSGGGIAAVGSGKAQLARVARALKPSEKETGLVARSIFRLPTAVYVNDGVEVSNLTHAQLVDIFTGRIINWQTVGGPDLRIKVVRREDTDSSLSVLRKSMPGWSDLDFTPRSKIAVTTQDAVETVKDVEGAIGFGPFSTSLETAVRVLEIQGLYPTDNNYPSAVTVSYVWREMAYSTPVRAFVEYGHSPKAQELLRAHGAVPVEFSGN